MMLESRQKSDDFTERFRLTLMGSDPLFWANKLYPGFMGGESDESGSYPLDDKDVEWKMPDITEEERERMIEELMARNPEAMTFEEYEAAQPAEDW